MGRAVAIAVALLGLGATVVPAQEVFWDDFEYGDLCAWSNPPVTVTQELEAVDAGGGNDSTADAEQISRCAIVDGTIGDPWDTEQGPGVTLAPDTDYYEIDVTGPALLRIRLERRDGLSDFQASGLVWNTDESDQFGLTGCDPVEGYPTVTIRQIYLPENGFVFLDPLSFHKEIPSNNKWYINIDDGRNFDLCGLFGPDLVGGANYTYRLTLSIDPVVGPPLTFPYVEEPVQMPGDGSILIYRVDGASVTNLDLIETLVDRNEPDLLDTKLYLVKKTGADLSTIAGNDDFDQVDFHLDSKIANQPLTAAPYFVMVDYWQKLKNGPIDMGLTIQYLQTIWH